MKLISRLTFDKLSFNKDNDTHVVVSLVAPKVSLKDKRAPIMIVPVVDVSGSMAGEKLAYAKQSLLKLLDHLQPGDFCGLVTFSDVPTLISSPVEITQAKRDHLKSLVAKIGIGGWTAFSGGMLMGLEQANKADPPQGMMVRVIMFTDGQANVGVQGPAILDLLPANLGRASLSAFGYGMDVDADLLFKISQNANGNYAFIKSPDDSPAAFAKELGGLLSTYAQNIRVTVESQGDHKVLALLSDVKSTVDGNKTSVSLAEILSEETRSLVLSMKVLSLSQADKLMENVKATVAKVNVVYDMVDSAGVKTEHVDACDVEIEFVNPSDAQTVASKEVDEVVALAQMAKSQAEAEFFVKAGNYDAAAKVMQVQSMNFTSRGHDKIGNLTSKLGSKMRSKSAYDASSGYLRSSYAATTRGMGTSSLDAEALADMTDVGINTCNETQQQIVESFTLDTPKVEAEVKAEPDSK